MGDFGSIFSSLSNNLGDFFSGNDSLSTYATVGKDALAIGGALGATGNGNMTTAGENQAVKGLRFSSMLEGHTLNPLGKVQTEVAAHSHNQFQAAEGADPMALENQWNQRLKTYAMIARETGVSETGR